MIQKNEILSHSIKAIAYRFSKAIAGSKDNFGEFRISTRTRNVNEIVNHMYDLVLKIKIKIKEGHFNCPPPEPLNFEGENLRFITGLLELGMIIKAAEIDIVTEKRLLQGPVLDMATHIGQISLLNGLNGNKIIKENYYAVDLSDE